MDFVEQMIVSNHVRDSDCDDIERGNVFVGLIVWSIWKESESGDVDKRERKEEG